VQVHSVPCKPVVPGGAAPARVDAEMLPGPCELATRPCDTPCDRLTPSAGVEGLLLAKEEPFVAGPGRHISHSVSGLRYGMASRSHVSSVLLPPAMFLVFHCQTVYTYHSGRDELTPLRLISKFHIYCSPLSC
jgi:hypothetical protein